MEQGANKRNSSVSEFFNEFLSSMRVRACGCAPACARLRVHTCVFVYTCLRVHVLCQCGSLRPERIEQCLYCFIDVLEED